MDRPAVIAQDALNALNAGGTLEDAIRKAIEVAALRGHVAERAFYQFQLAKLTVSPGEWMPSDIFKIWRQIDSEFPKDRVTSKQVRENVQKEYGDSRAIPDDSSKYWSGSIGALEEVLAKFALLENDPRGLQADLAPSRDVVRAVYGRIRTRIVSYLKEATN